MISMVAAVAVLDAGRRQRRAHPPEPICAGMCAAREDRLTEVVPYLQVEIDRQEEQFGDASQYVRNARRFQ